MLPALAKVTIAAAVMLGMGSCSPDPAPQRRVSPSPEPTLPSSKPFTMPDFVGRRYETAETQARRLELVSIRVERASSEKPGTVLAQRPAAGKTVSPNTVIDLVVAIPLCEEKPPEQRTSGEPLAQFPGHVDPDDTSGRFDLKRIVYFKAHRRAPMWVTIRTYPRWRSSDLAPFSGNAMRVFLEVDEDPEADYVAAIKFRKHRLVAVIRGEGQTCEPIRVRRPGRSALLAFRITGRSPPNPIATDIGIAVKTEFISSLICDPASGGVLCVDRAPDAGFAVP